MPTIDNSKQKSVSKFEQHFVNKGFILGKNEGRAEGRAEGRVEGIAEGEIKAVLKFIRWQRNRRIQEAQILEALLSGFELDETTARQYMDVM